MSKLIAIIALFLFVSLVSELKSQATDEQVYHLLEIMDTESQFMTGLEMTLAMQEQSGQTAMLPDGFKEEFIKEAKTGFKTDLLPKMMVIYQNKFTADEIIELTEFYKSDTGQLLLDKMPIVQAEAANAGMIWGQQLGMKVAEKLMSKE